MSLQVPLSSAGLLPNWLQEFWILKEWLTREFDETTTEAIAKWWRAKWKCLWWRKGAVSQRDPAGRVPEWEAPLYGPVLPDPLLLPHPWSKERYGSKLCYRENPVYSHYCGPQFSGSLPFLFFYKSDSDSGLKQPGISLQFFVLDVYNSDGTSLTVDQLHMQLEKIWNSSLQTNKEPIGILTSQHRNTWGKAYNNLIKGGRSSAESSNNPPNVRDKNTIPPQIRQTRSQCAPSRKASSPCVWMRRCRACRTKCTRAAWLRRCCTEGGPAGTAETAGSTRPYRSVSTSEPALF